MKSSLIIYDELPSTQDTARAAALKGEPEGLAVMALKQTQGRGRIGRDWVSPQGKNLALSFILRPGIGPEEAALLGLLASVAVAQTAEDLGVERALLKWPNDVLAGGRKLAGILPEARITGASVEFIIMGIGLNVNAEPADFPAHLRDGVTSILQCCGRESSLEHTARGLLGAFEGLYSRVPREGTSFIREEWQKRWAHKGLPVTREGQTGIAEGLGRDGSLLLRLPSGELRGIHSGTVEPVSVPGS